MAAAFRRPLERLVSADHAERWDVVVVGAGPAGSTAAAGIATAGASVLLVDRQPFPRWKVCGACLGPTALRVLDDPVLAEHLAVAGAVTLERLEVVGFGKKALVPLGGHLALSRPRLDLILTERATAAGARFESGCAATLRSVDAEAATLELRQGGVTWSARAAAVVDATGLGAGLSLRDASRRGGSVAADARIGLGASYGPAPEVDLPPGRLLMCVGKSGYVGLVRVEAGSLCVAAAVDRSALASRGPDATVSAILAESGGPPLPPAPDGWTGTPPLTREPAARAGPRLFRVGDAAGYVEPFTGEGMGWAVASGLAVAPFALDAVSEWRAPLARRWIRTHAARVGTRQRLCRLLARGLRRPGLVRASLGALERVPTLAAPLVRWAGAGP